MLLWSAAPQMDWRNGIERTQCTFAPTRGDLHGPLITKRTKFHQPYVPTGTQTMSRFAGTNAHCFAAGQLFVVRLL